MSQIVSFAASTRRAGSLLLVASVVLGAQATSGRAVADESLAKLTASNATPFDQLGQSAAISGDTIVVGTTSGIVGNTVHGIAHVFVEPASGWSGRLHEAATLIPSDGDNFDSFAVSVAVSGDTIVVGAYEHDIAGSEDVGAAYVYVRPPGGWAGTLTETAKLTASDGAINDTLGMAVAMSGDTIAAGARPTIGANPGQGAVYVFIEPAGGWAGELAESAKLTASDGKAFDELGSRVSLDGGTIVASALFADLAPRENQGAAYVFVEPAGSWAGELTENAKLTASDANVMDQFGDGIAVSGPVVVVGVFNGEVGSQRDQGYAAVFVEPPGGWAGNLNETLKLAAPDGVAQDHFGDSAAVENGVVVVGCPFDGPEIGEHPGSAYVFSGIGAKRVLPDQSRP